MQFPQIRLQSQMARIQITQRSGQLSIEQPKAIQSIEQPKADLKIETTPSKLTIDQTQAWNEMGLKNVFVRTREVAQHGHQDVMKGIARRIREGTELMEIENDGNPIKRHGKQNSEGEPKQFNIGWIPSHGSVKINFQPAKVDINVTPSRALIDTQIQKAIIDYQHGSTEIDILKQNSLSIDFENLKHHGINFEINI